MDEISNVLQKISASRERSSNLRDHKELTSRLDRINGSVVRAGQIVEKTKPIINIPSLKDIIGGFMKMSPVFNNTKFSKWMGRVDTHLQKTADSVKIVSGGNDNDSSKDNLDVEYLDLISDGVRDSNKNLERLHDDMDALQDIRSGFDRIHEKMGKKESTLERQSTPDTEQLMRTEIDAISHVGDVVSTKLQRIHDDLSKWNDEDKLYRAQQAKGGKELPRASSVHPTGGDATDSTSGSAAGGGALGAILGVAGMKVLGMIKGIPKFFAMILNPLKAIKGIGGLLNTAKKLFKVGPLALIFGLIDFFKGFSDAENILGRGNLSFVEKVQAGLSAVIRGFGEIVDWVMGLFGINTTVGKTLQEWFIKLTDLPVKWINNIVDWVKNSLFKGIGSDTSLSDIPGKLWANLTVEIKKMIGWIGDCISDAVDYSGKKLSEFGTTIKKTFYKYVVNPVIRLLNGITGTIFDVLDSLADIIPDSLGGKEFRQKLGEYRKIATIDEVFDEDLNPKLPEDKQKELIKQTTDSLKKTFSDYDGSQNPLAYAADKFKVITKPENAEAVKPVENTELKPTMKQAMDDIINKGQFKPVQKETATAVNQVAVDNKKTIQTQNTFNSPAIVPDNQFDTTRSVWGWN